MAVKYADVPESPEETDAVGVPPAMFNTANFAEVVAFPPITKSLVVLFSMINPPGIA